MQKMFNQQLFSLAEPYPFQRYIILFLAVVVTFFCIVCIVQNVMAFKTNKIVKNSIVLLELKSARAAHLTIAGAFFIVFTATLIGGIFSKDFRFELLIWSAGSLAVASRVFVAGVLAKNAIVNDGIFTKGRFYHWHKLYNYFIDKDKCRLIFTTDEKGFHTLLGTSFPLKFPKSKLENIEYIFNVNQSKFSGTVE